MKIKKLKCYYVVLLEKEEEIIDSLKKFAEKNKISGAFLYGIGVGKRLTLGYFDSHNKSYIRKKFEGEYEFTNLSGNISVLDGKDTIVHIHVTITDSSFNAFGGHLFEGYIPATCEIVVLPFGESLERKKDEETGLNLLNLS